MVSPVRRMRILRELLSVRLGPGAAILNKEIKRINLTFAVSNKDGHMGARKFWRECLPRLKYHNPAVSMTVQRHQNQDDPALLTIFIASKEAQEQSNTDSPASTPAPTRSTAKKSNSPTTPNHPASEHVAWDKTIEINMKGRHSNDIIEEFMEETGAQSVEPSDEEQQQLRQLAEHAERAQIDRERVRVKLEKERREQRVLAEAQKSFTGGI